MGSLLVSRANTDLVQLGRGIDSGGRRALTAGQASRFSVGLGVTIDTRFACAPIAAKCKEAGEIPQTPIAVIDHAIITHAACALDETSVGARLEGGAGNRALLMPTVRNARSDMRTQSTAHRMAPNTPKIELCMVWRRRDNSEALHALRAILLQTFREKSLKHPL
jgi:hypothetical protein